MRSVELVVDVTDAAGLGEEATIALTVHLPPSPAEPRVVAIARPGVGFNRGYFTRDLPGPGSGIGSQAEWHAAHGWVFVSVDHLGVGDSSSHDEDRLTFAVMTAAAAAADRALVGRLVAGTIATDLPPIADPVVLGIGHSMGGGLAVVQQARHRTYDGIAVLGQSAVFNEMPASVPAPLGAPTQTPWFARDRRHDDPAGVLNPGRVRPEMYTAAERKWGFHYDDVEISGLGRGPWAARQLLPAVNTYLVSPGAIASEAAAVDVPVLVAMGERDVPIDPKGEPRAYLSANSVDLFVCPRLGHVHNVGGPRERFWERVHTWGDWVAADRGSGGGNPPEPG